MEAFSSRSSSIGSQRQEPSVEESIFRNSYAPRATQTHHAQDSSGLTPQRVRPLQSVFTQGRDNLTATDLIDIYDGSLGHLNLDTCFEPYNVEGQFSYSGFCKRMRLFFT